MSASNLAVETRKWNCKLGRAAPAVDEQEYARAPDLSPGDLIAAVYASNFGKRSIAKYVNLIAMLEAASWGAELAT